MRGRVHDHRLHGGASHVHPNRELRHAWPSHRSCTRPRLTCQSVRSVVPEGARQGKTQSAREAGRTLADTCVSCRDPGNRRLPARAGLLALVGAEIALFQRTRRRGPLRPVIARRSTSISVIVASAALLAACVAPAGPGAPGSPPVARAPAPAPNAATTAPAQPPVHVQILAFNDLHGHLEPPAGDNGVVRAAPDDPVAASPGTQTSDAGVAYVPTGGAATLAAHIEKLRAAEPNTVVVSAGDLTGASPLLSNLFHDEPTVLAMNRLGLDFEGVGNHDFDRGIDELRRLQTGGCYENDCDAGAFQGAAFKYLAANVRETATGRTVFPPYAIRDFQGARVAFIGETLAQTPSVTDRPRRTRPVVRRRGGDRERAGARARGAGRRGDRASPPSGGRAGRRKHVRLVPRALGRSDADLAAPESGHPRRRQRAHPPGLRLHRRRPPRHERRQLRPARHEDRSHHRPGGAEGLGGARTQHPHHARCRSRSGGRPIWSRPTPRGREVSSTVSSAG